MRNPLPVVNYGQVVDGLGGHRGVEQLSAHRDADDLEIATAATTIHQALEALKAAEVHADVMSSPDDRVAAALQTALAEHAQALGGPAGVVEGVLAVKFDRHDLGWMRAILGAIKERLNIGRFDFLPSPTAATSLPDTTRVALLGDWGTNLYGAPHCADAIQSDGQFGAVVHLGDVYYSGSATEIHERFLAEWPFVPGALNRACNSNHEMYSGGKPYAEITLPRFHQDSSLFWLENTHWVLLGLDSAYDEGRLGPLQVQWVTRTALHARAAGKQILLFSHHPPWRTDTGETLPLTTPIVHVLERGLVAGWYWGHEHLCALFDPHPIWHMWGSCIAHSGFPYVRPDVASSGWQQAGEVVADDSTWHRIPMRGQTPAGLVLDGPNRWVPGHESDFGPNGYAVLELDGPHLRELVLSPDGTVVHDRTLA
ncbi:MAG: metallophosphoesterase [Nocardioides sp.]|nr:metallophosphoesterase [Nocardioides sp.]